MIYKSNLVYSYELQSVKSWKHVFMYWHPYLYGCIRNLHRLENSIVHAIVHTGHRRHLFILGLRACTSSIPFHLYVCDTRIIYSLESSLNHLCEASRLQKPVFWVGMYESVFVNRCDAVFSFLGFVTCVSINWLRHRLANIVIRQFWSKQHGDRDHDG